MVEKPTHYRKMNAFPLLISLSHPIMNRISKYFADPLEPERLADFFEIDSFDGTFLVPPEVAAEVDRMLQRLFKPRWIVLHDVTGARHRIRPENIRRISESTSAQRAALREFNRVRRLEEGEDHHPWEDDL